MNIEVQEVLLRFETRHFSGIMTDSELDSGGKMVQLLKGAGDCCLQRVWTSSESQIASYSMGIKSFFVGVNWSWLEADHSPPTGAKVKNYWSYTFSPPYAFVACTRTTYFIRAQRLSWLGHIESLQGTKMVKTIYSLKPISRRSVGRPKTRWVDDVRRDIHSSISIQPLGRF